MIFEDKLLLVVFSLAVIFISTAAHEIMHAFVALKLGDDLAHSRGRISLNPMSHIDPFLTLILPLLLLTLGQQPILAAKPVPINTTRLKGGENGMALVALAGPLTNLLIAALFVPVIKWGGLTFLRELAALFFQINVGLFVFNMLPIPPIDGSRLLYAVAPRPVQEIMEQIESFGVLGVIIIVSLAYPFISPILQNSYEFVGNLLL
jgi:Zn-dependent protease